MMNDEGNVEEFLKALSYLSREYGLILYAGREDNLLVSKMDDLDRHPDMGYVAGDWSIEWEKVKNV